MDTNERFSMQMSIKQVFLAGVAAGALGAIALGFVLMVAKGASFGDMFNGSARAVPNVPTGAAPADPGAGEQVGAVIPVSNDDHLRGDKSAPVTLIEYSDFQCPFCSRFHPTLQQVMNDYKGKVNWVYRHFPLTSIHPYAQKAAEASECASEQGKFWEMADLFFGKQDQWTATGLDATTLENLAKEAGVKDLKKFSSCVTSGKYTALVQADEAGGEQAGVTGTPGTIIIAKDGSKQLIPGALPYDAVKQMIDSALAGS